MSSPPPPIDRLLERVEKAEKVISFRQNDHLKGAFLFASRCIF
jgi:hypothetical protein